MSRNSTDWLGFRNTGLLSFGEEAESVEAAEAAAAKRINITRPDRRWSLAGGLLFNADVAAVVDPGTPSVPEPLYVTRSAEPSSSKGNGKSTDAAKANREKSEEVRNQHTHGWRGSLKPSPFDE
jgi:hypothetical protein